MPMTGRFGAHDDYPEDDLMALIAEVRAVLGRTRAGHPGRAAALNDLGVVLQLRYRQVGDTALLTEALAHGRQAVAMTPVGQPAHLDYLGNLVNGLLLGYGETGDLVAIQEAAARLLEGIAALADGDARRAGLLSLLCTTWRLQFEKDGDTATMWQAVDVGRDAVVAAPVGHPGRAMCLRDLALMLEAVFEWTGGEEVLEEAVAAAQEAVAITAPGDGERPLYLSVLGTVLLARATFVTPEVAVLREAIATLDEAAQVFASSTGYHVELPSCLHNLAQALEMLHERTGKDDALDDALAVARAALQEAGAHHPERALFLNTLGQILQAVFDRTDDGGALNEAVRAGRAAVAASTEDGNLWSVSRSNLGSGLISLFERTGDSDALEEAAALFRAAMDKLPAGHPGAAGIRSNLGTVLQVQFEDTGDLAALAEAVELFEAAAELSPDGHPDRPTTLTRLAAARQAWAERTGECASLANAVAAARAAVAATPAGDPRRAGHLSNLGMALRMHALQSGAGKDQPAEGHSEADAAQLREAVAALRDAVGIAPADHPGRVMFKHNLAVALYSVAQHPLTSVADIDSALPEAIALGREVVSATAADDAGMAGHLIPLGGYLEAWHRRTGDPSAADEALRRYGVAAASKQTPTRQRLEAYAAMLRMYSADPGHSVADALAAVEATVALLPRLAPRYLARADREHALGGVAGLAKLAAATAVTAGRPDRAVELLEQTRGLLAADALDARSTDLGRLRERQPALAAEFESLRARIDTLERAVMGNRPGLGTETSDETDAARGRARNLRYRLRDLLADWNKLLARIRVDEPGFMVPRSASDLTAEAKDGPIVFLYAAEDGCGALILTGDVGAPVLFVPLAVTESEVADWADRLHSVVTGQDGANAARMPPLLGWMWDAITEPVLSALRYDTTPVAADDWPRLWWCPVGVFAHFPWHAAGYHQEAVRGDPRPRTVLDRVISSYTATVRALAYARTERATAGTGMVIVAVPAAPGLPLLIAADEEAELLEDLIPGSCLLPEPTRAHVMDALADYAVVHFACHGVADWDDPAASQLILADAASAGLTVADIATLHPTGMELAYLSACQTSMVSPRFADEAVHITGAFQLVGYRHVVGTLWAAYDATARDLAVDFYTRLTGGGVGPPAVARSADALHHAVKCLRSKPHAAALKWAAYMHTGP